MLTDLVRDIWNSYPDIFSDEEIDSIFEALFPLTNQDKSIKEILQAVQTPYRMLKDTNTD